MKIRVGFVGYRDITDKQRFDIIDFTENVDEVKKFIGKLVAMGGGDTCEDLAGGFQKTLQLSWESETRYAI